MKNFYLHTLLLTVWEKILGVQFRSVANIMPDFKRGESLERKRIAWPNLARRVSYFCTELTASELAAVFICALFQLHRLVRRQSLRNGIAILGTPTCGSSPCQATNQGCNRLPSCMWYTKAQQALQYLQHLFHHDGWENFASCARLYRTRLPIRIPFEQKQMLLVS